MKNLILFGLILALASCCSEPVYSPVAEINFHKKCQVKLLHKGREALLHRIKLIRSAKKSISIQTFIWTNDACGRLMINELSAAARRGVNVRIVCDHLFSYQDPRAINAITRNENLQIKIYNPAGDHLKTDTLNVLLETVSDFKKINQRMHNKLFLIDNEQAVCGGRNIEDTYYDNNAGLNFKDLDIAVSGPVCEAMVQSFEQFWKSPLAVPINALKDVDTTADIDESILRLDTEEEKLFMQKVESDLISYEINKGYFAVDKMSFCSDLPGKNKSSDLKGSSELNEFIIGKLKESKKRIWIQSPYLVFSDRAKKVFEEIRDEKPNLGIRISTNSLAATDSWPTYAFLYKQKKMLIGDLGIKIFEYKPLPADLKTIIPNYSQLLKKMSQGKIIHLSEEERLNGNADAYPKLCLHSKCMLIDDHLSFIGSYNLDPRSANLNTELSVIIMDEKFNQLIAKHMERDTSGGNSWVVAKRQILPGIKQLNDLIGAVNSLGASITGVDLWPRQYTSCFELKPGHKEVSSEHPDFYTNYRSVGNFPKVSSFSEKEILTRFFKVFAQALKPII